jgi:hypothetical protein
MNSNPNADPIEDSRNVEAQRILTSERVPGNVHYYEKNGLRTEGDGENHEEEPPVSPLEP